MIKAITGAIFTYVFVDFVMSVLTGKSLVIKKRLDETKNSSSQKHGSDDILDKTFQERFLQPIVDKLIHAVSTMLPVKAESQLKLADRLLKAGITTNPKDYRAMNVIIIVGFGLVGLYLAITSHQRGFSRIMYMLMGMAGGYVYRRYSLEGKITKRKKIIKGQLPEVMDILSVSVVAGLSFDQALGHVTTKAEGPLIEEFRICQREIMLGKPRKEALNRLSERTEIEEVKSFTNAIIQADELGISLQNVLMSQSQMIRTSHRQDVEERAAKIPVKILIPMVLFIFPVIFIILLGPAVPTIIDALGGR